ncbi:MAG TPA: hypothetical protein VJT72_16620 [Pseudonocardiaceae bacterium]|nr:hypothetical protein [Pseudonocardiaceae bacterium]
MRTRYANGQARVLRLDSAPALLLAPASRVPMIGVGIARPSYSQGGSQAINRLYAARGQPDIARTGRAKGEMVLDPLGDVSFGHAVKGDRDQQNCGIVGFGR